MKRNGYSPFAMLVMCIWCMPAFSQSSITVLEAITNAPLKGAVVILQNKNEKKQQFFFTDADGHTGINCIARTAIRIHYVGFEEQVDTIFPGQQLTVHLLPSKNNLDEVVVTGQYDVNTSDKSVYNVKVVNEKTIRQMGAQNLSDVLGNQLAMQMSQDQVLGSSVQIDGISGQNVKVLVDGIAVAGRENGNIDLSQINLNNVERIEIIEGPMSVSYGTDALGGLINIVTKKTSSYPLEGNVHLYYETEGTYNGDGALYWKHGHNGSSLSGGRYFFDGYSPIDTSRFQEWKPREQYFGTLNYNYSGNAFNLGAKTEYFNETIQNKGQPVYSPYAVYAFDDYYLTQRINQSIVGEYRFRNHAKLQMINGYNYYRRIKNTYRKDLVTLDQDLSAGEGSQDTSHFNEWTLRGTYSSLLPMKKINFQAGYDLILQSGSGENITEGTQHINDYAAFGSMEYEAFNNFFLRPGVRFAYNTRYGSPVTPSLNIKYDVNPQLTIRAGYARGFRSPSLKELDLDFVDVSHNIHGNDSLKAETSDNFNAAVTMKRNVGDLRFKVETSLFFNNISNVITLALIDAANGYYSYVNLEHYKSRGGTFSVDLKWNNLSATAGFSLLALYNRLSDSADVDQFSYTPEFQCNLTWAIPKAGADISMFFKNTGSTPGYNLDAQGQVYQTIIASSNMMDLIVTKYFMQHNCSVSCGVKNIFDVKDLYSNVAGASPHGDGGDSTPYARGRFAFASLNLKLFKQ